MLHARMPARSRTGAAITRWRRGARGRRAWAARRSRAAARIRSSWRALRRYSWAYMAGSLRRVLTRLRSTCRAARGARVSLTAPACALRAPRMHSLVVPCREPKLRSPDRHRRQAGFCLVPSDDSRSYLGRRRAETRAGYVQRVSHLRYLARHYWFDLLVAL